MSSDHIQPERDPARSHDDVPGMSGRAWVKRDLEFWQRCTIERWRDTYVTVSLDNMDEFTVDPADVAQFDLEPGDFVFLQHWIGSLSGHPVFVVGVSGETAEVEATTEFFNKPERMMCLLRDLRFYRNLKPEPLNKGVRVFAYKTTRFTPDLFLMFPATIEARHYDICYEVEFGDGESSYVPATLIEKRAFDVGDVVYTCTDLNLHSVTHGDSWTPCRIVGREGNNLLLQDRAGERFETNTSMIAVLPRGYRMVDGKFEKITSALVDPIRPLAEAVSWVHIVRAPHWLDAADDPITKEHVEGLLAADAELSWSTTEWQDWADEEGMVARHFAIVWRGKPCIWWYRNEIKCAAPSEDLLAKMIDIAIALDANVIGDDGHEYH